MSVDRWWNALARWRKSDARASVAPPATSTTSVLGATTSTGAASDRNASTTAASAVRARDARAAAKAIGDGNADVPRGVASDASAADPIVEEEPVAVRNLRFFAWLLGTRPNAAARPPAPTLVAEMLGRVDETIASDAQRAALLPRAPHVVPQLMKTLRDESYSSADVAGRISRDVVLTAEVVRSASAVLARGDDGEEIDLARAVQVIGTQGLRRAIANVVLRPMFDTRGSSLSARAANQIWKDADRKARLAAAFAGEAGLDPFDGYLAGLLHNSGWTAVLRAIDNLEDLSIGAGEVTHPDVVPHVIRRRDALFGALVGRWNLGKLMDALADEIGRVGLEHAQSPLGVALREADRLAALRALAADGARAAAIVSRWSTLARPVQDAYTSLT